MGAMWFYTVLRIGLFLALGGLLWLVGVRGLFGWFLAAVLSMPLSYVLLAGPRRTFASTVAEGVEARRDARHVRAEKLEEVGTEELGDDG